MAGFSADQFVISGALSGFRHAEPTGKRMSKRADSATFTHFSPQGRSRSLLWLCDHGTLTELQEVPALSETEPLPAHHRTTRGVMSRCRCVLVRSKIGRPGGDMRGKRVHSGVAPGVYNRHVLRLGTGTRMQKALLPRLVRVLRIIAPRPGLCPVLAGRGS